MSGFLIIAGIWCKKIGFLIYDNWKAVLLVVAGLIVFIYLLSFSSCFQPNNDKLKEEILIEKIEANQLSNKKVEIETNVNQAAVNSKSAESNFNQSLNKDSNSFKGNAEDAFCTRFCLDSSCVNFRKRHPELICKATN